MIATLLQHKNIDNELIVTALIEFIEYKNISSSEELKKYQTDAFNTDDQNKQILVAKHIVKNSILDLDNLDYKNSVKVYTLKQTIDKITDSNELIKNLLTIFALTEKNLMFYFDAYNYILEEKL